MIKTQKSLQAKMKKKSPKSAGLHKKKSLQKEPVTLTTKDVVTPPRKETASSATFPPQKVEIRQFEAKPSSSHKPQKESMVQEQSIPEAKETMVQEVKPVQKPVLADKENETKIVNKVEKSTGLAKKVTEKLSKIEISNGISEEETTTKKISAFGQQLKNI